MKNLKIELVEDWHKALTWSSVRLSLIFAGLLAAAPHLLQLAVDQWPNFAPWLMQFFPSASASVMPAISSLLYILLRLTTIRFVSPASFAPTSAPTPAPTSEPPASQ